MACGGHHPACMLSSACMNSLLKQQHVACLLVYVMLSRTCDLL
jgi:hypothetical protein